MSSRLFDADWLGVDENNGYGQLPIPDARDRQITTLIQCWLALEQTAQENEAASIQERQRFTLLAYSERMASNAVREQDIEYSFLGLLALGLDGWHGDWRDNAALLSLHYDAARKCHLAPETVFLRAAGFMSKKVASALRAFLNRPEEDKALNAMGYEESRDADGFRYKRTW